MCNAWNHPPNCRCGWGGEFHASSYRTDRSQSGISTLTYTVPGALCPVCGAEAFFYMSPHGGRVFFDELGPPWPKHPCTDNGRPVRPVNGTQRTTHVWARDGWEPLIILDAVVYSPNVTSLECMHRAEVIQLYLPRNKKSDNQQLTTSSLVQAKKVDEFRYFLSALSEQAQVVQLFAYKRSFDAQLI